MSRPGAIARNALRLFTLPRLIVLVVLAGLLLRAAAIVEFRPAMLRSDPLYYHRAAVGLLRGEGFHMGRTRAYQPPGYPAFLAGVYAVAGARPAAGTWANVFLGLITLPLVALVAFRLGGWGAALLSTALAATHPTLVWYSAELLSENLFIPGLLGTLAPLLHPARSPGAFLAAGVVAGLTVLVRETALPILLLVALAYLCVTRDDARRYRHVTLFVGAMLAVLALWSFRNWMVLGRFVPVATNAGINFYLANNPRADGGPTWMSPPGIPWNRADSPPDFETRASTTGFQEGLAFIRRHPGAYLALLPRRAAWFFQQPSLSGRDSTLMRAVTAFRIAHCVLLWLLLLICLWRSPAGRWVLLWPIVAVPVLLLLAFHGQDRYRLTSEVGIILLAPALLAPVWSRMTARGESQAARPAVA